MRAVPRLRPERYRRYSSLGLSSASHLRMLGPSMSNARPHQSLGYGTPAEWYYSGLMAA